MIMADPVDQLFMGVPPLVNALLVYTFAAVAIFLIFKYFKAQRDVVKILRPKLKGLALYTVGWHDPFIFWRHRKDIRQMPEGHWLRWTWLYMLALLAGILFLILTVPLLRI